MNHNMNLSPVPFEMIKSGQKTIELRLNDEKRLKQIHKFESFAQLYKSLPLLSCGYTQADIETAKPEDMDVYYSPERQKEYGVLGIEIERE